MVGKQLGAEALGQVLPSRGQRARPPKRRHASVVHAKKKTEYGSGRSMLPPGFADMLETGGGSGGSGSGATSTPARPSSSSSSSAASKPTRPGHSSSSASTAASKPSRPSGDGGAQQQPGAGGEGPSLGEYLHFGRLLGERPQQVQQQLDMGKADVRVDERSRAYLQSWEQQEEEAYAMFEAVVAAEPARSGVDGSAAARKLQRNKNVVSSAGSAEQLLRGARSDRDAGVAMSAAQRKLARNKGKAGAMGAGMDALGELMRQAAADEEEGGFELLVAARPASGGAVQLAAKPARASELEDFEYDEELDIEDMWADVEADTAAARSPQSNRPLTKPSLSGTASRMANKPSGGSGPAFSARGSGSLEAVGQLKDSLLERPAKPAQQEDQPDVSGWVRMNLRKSAAPTELAAKPRASASAQAEAQRPLPPVPAPKPTLASKPSRPAAAAEPAPVVAPAQPAAKPELAAKPAKPQAAAAAPAPAQPAIAPKPAARKTEAAAAQDSTPKGPQLAAKPAAAPPPAAAAPAIKAPERTPAAAPAAADAPEQIEAPTPAPVAVTAAPIEQPAVVAADAEEQPVGKINRPQRAPASARQGAQEGARSPPATQRLQQERRAANAAYGAEALLDRRVEALTVWQTNAAGVLVRNDQLSGFVPTSLLAPALVAQVLEEEQKLAAATAAGLIVARLEQQDAPGAAAEGAQLDAATKSAVRRSALAAVMMGRQLSARVVNVDEQTGRVVLSERAAVSARKDRNARAAPPTAEELRAAASLLGQVVDATVVVVKPFGCFLEFAVDLAPPGGDDQGPQQAQQARQAVLVGLVHSSEVSWDPAADAMQAVQVGQAVKAKIMHVDAAKARVFLSLRRTAPNPLLETLDSLVTMSAAAAAEARAAPSGTAAGAAAAAAADALDQRPVLGDLPEAARFCELLRATPSVRSATLGVRLQSRAASQGLEVFIAKDSSAGIGTAVAAVDAGTGAPGAAEAAAAPGAESYNLVLRKEQSVQEVALVADLGREEVRQLAASCVQRLSEAESASTVAV